MCHIVNIDVDGRVEISTRHCHFVVGISTCLRRALFLFNRRLPVYRTGDRLVGVLGHNEERRQKEERKDLFAGSESQPDKLVWKINVYFALTQAPNDSM